jgi:hypothetical protein
MVYPMSQDSYTVFNATNKPVCRNRKTKLEVMIMKSLIKAVAIAAVLAAPVVSFAQSNQPVTRAEVRNQLVQLEKAGYNPSNSNDTQYPANIQAAEAKVAAANGSVANSGVGGVADGSSQAGQPKTFAATTYSVPVFEHH